MTRPIRPGYLLNKFPAAAPAGGGPGFGVDNWQTEEGDVWLTEEGDAWLTEEAA